MDSHSAKAFLKTIKRRLEDVLWEAYGLAIKKPVLADRPRVFLFICKGNVCRSPFAEYFARWRSKVRSLVFMSAGLDVSTSHPAPEAALSASERFGVQMRDHRSQPLTHEMLQAADAVIVMEIAQLKELQKRFPTKSDRIYPLALFDAHNKAPLRGYEKYNIKDPYGGSVDDFARCYGRIIRCLDTLLQVETSGPAETTSKSEHSLKR